MTRAASASQRSCGTVVSVSSLSSVAAWAALVGGALWLAQGVVLVAGGGARIGSQDRGCHFLLRVYGARGCRRNRILGEFGSQGEGREGGARCSRRPVGSRGRVPRASGSLCGARIALARERRHRPRDRPRRNRLWDQLAKATSALGLGARAGAMARLASPGSRLRVGIESCGTARPDVASAIRRGPSCVR